MKMKLFAVGAALVSVGLFARPAHAQNVTVSSTTVTTIIGSDAGRAEVFIYNKGSGNLYYAKTSAGATMAAGMVLAPSTGVELLGFKGTIYGLADSSVASDDVRYFTVAR